MSDDLGLAMLWGVLLFAVGGFVLGLVFSQTAWGWLQGSIYGFFVGGYLGDFLFTIAERYDWLQGNSMVVMVMCGIVGAAVGGLSGLLIGSKK